MNEDLLRRGLTDADAYRVVEAFSRLGQHLQKWPTSRTVIEALPPARQMRTASRLIAPTPMDDYVDKYMASHPLSSKKDACLAFLREKQLLKNLPASLTEEEAEAKAEREAIQSEPTT